VGTPFPDVAEFWIYNNKFDDPGNCTSGHVFLEGHGDNTPWTNATGTAYVFNNVFIAGSLGISEGTNHLIANNTFIGSPINIGDNSNPIIKNNYLSSTGLGGTFLNIQETTISTPSTVDYNVYADGTGYNLWSWPGYDKTSNFALYKSQCGTCDVHSYDDSGYPSGGTYGGVNQTTGRPAVDSDVVGNGVDLSGLGITALNLDKDGVVRGVAWDIGAYEYTSRVPDTTPPAAPSGLVVQ
jgi:hypothetical protein